MVVIRNDNFNGIYSRNWTLVSELEPRAHFMDNTQGATGANAEGAGLLEPTIRRSWGSVAMAMTAGAGAMFGKVE